MRRLVIGVLASLAVTACGGAAGAGATRPAAATAPPAATSTPLVRDTVDATLGQVLVDAAGRMLYLFMPERGGHVVCIASCTTTWLPLLAPGTAPPSSATPLPGQLDVIDRPDGGRQVTYDEWPLYRFADDRQPGQALGERAGGEWFAVPVDGSSGLPTPTPLPPPAAAPPVQLPAPPPRMQLPFNDHDRDNAGGPSDGDGNG